MRIIRARNVHQALPEGVYLLKHMGQHASSRNGPVRVIPSPVATAYLEPRERLVCWPQRDINIAFLVYEALWMLQGRNDLEPLVRYVKHFNQYSDDGVQLHGAYGYRWRKHFGFDQLAVVAERLKQWPNDRRSVVVMWDPKVDLNPMNVQKDLPCNDAITFQRSPANGGALNMSVFCRSNDVIWGAYFANAFHFSMLLEYMALWIGCPVGTYTQISVNYHAYVEKLDELKDIPHPQYQPLGAEFDPYSDGSVHPADMWHTDDKPIPDIRMLDQQIEKVVWAADADFRGMTERGNSYDRSFNAINFSPMMRAALAVLHAHSIYRNREEPERFTAAMERLAREDIHCDWIQAMMVWVTKRQQAWQSKMMSHEAI